MESHNNKIILIFEIPIALVEVENIDRVSSFKADQFSSLLSSMYLYIRVKVIFERNYLNVMLSNDSIRDVKEMFYNT